MNVIDGMNHLMATMHSAGVSKDETIGNALARLPLDNPVHTAANAKWRCRDCSRIDTLISIEWLAYDGLTASCPRCGSDNLEMLS